jgi:outer membrane lipoprotein-sorting protein
VQGNRTHFSFEGVRENTGLKDELFRFEVPKGVEVIRG